MLQVTSSHAGHSQTVCLLTVVFTSDVWVVLTSMTYYNDLLCIVLWLLGYWYSKAKHAHNQQISLCAEQAWAVPWLLESGWGTAHWKAGPTARTLHVSLAFAYHPVQQCTNLP